MLHLLRVYGKSLESSQWPPVHRPLLAAEYSRRKEKVWYQGAALLIQRREIKNSRANMLWSSSGWRRIRTFEGIASRFTVCPLWPLGNPSVNEFIIYKEESFCKIFFRFFGYFVCQSVFEKAFPQSARPTLQYILLEFSCHSPLRCPHPGKIFHKL